MLIVTLGISGSGKSTWIKDHSQGRIVVCPDKIRKELTGSVSDQSKNGEVFKLAYERTKKALFNHSTVIFDSTALNERTRKELISMAQIFNTPASLVVFMDSLKPEVCRARVEHDIRVGVDRSDTRRQDIIDRQYQSFKVALKHLASEGWTNILEV